MSTGEAGQCPGDDTQGRGRLVDPYAGGVPRHGRHGEVQFVGDQRGHVGALVPVRGEGPDGATELHREPVPPHPAQAAPSASSTPVSQPAQTSPNVVGDGVLQQRTADLQGVAVSAGEVSQRRSDVDQGRRDDVDRAGDDEGHRGVDHVLTGRTEVDEAAGRARHPGPQVGDQRHDPAWPTPPPAGRCRRRRSRRPRIVPRSRRPTPAGRTRPRRRPARSPPRRRASPAARRCRRCRRAPDRSRRARRRDRRRRASAASDRDVVGRARRTSKKLDHTSKKTVSWSPCRWMSNR